MECMVVRSWCVVDSVASCDDSVEEFERESSFVG